MVCYYFCVHHWVQGRRAREREEEEKGRLKEEMQGGETVERGGWVA